VNSNSNSSSSSPSSRSSSTSSSSSSSSSIRGSRLVGGRSSSCSGFSSRRSSTSISRSSTSSSTSSSSSSSSSSSCSSSSSSSSSWPTPSPAWPLPLYHEPQKNRSCALHAVNNFLGEKRFLGRDFRKFADILDKRENELLVQPKKEKRRKRDGYTKRRKRKNRGVGGDFSVQVVMAALSSVGINVHYHRDRNYLPIGESSCQKFLCFPSFLCFFSASIVFFLFFLSFCSFFLSFFLSFFVSV